MHAIVGDFASHHSIREGLLNAINLERQGEHIDNNRVKAVVDMRTDMGNGCLSVYTAEFEEASLPATSLSSCSSTGLSWTRSRPRTHTTGMSCGIAVSRPWM